MNFLRVNITFNDAVNITHDIITRNLYPYTAKVMLEVINLTLEDKQNTYIDYI